VERDVPLAVPLADDVHDASALAQLELLELEARQLVNAQACRGEQLTDRDIANRAVLVDRPEQAPKLARAQRDPSRRIDRRDGDVHHRGGANQGGRLGPSEEDHETGAAAL
jgi:hypothetical protein